MSSLHVSVFKQEAIAALQIKPDGIYVDATLGRAGHSLEIVKRLTTGKLIAFDLDTTAINESHQVVKDYLDKIVFINSNYANIEEQLQGLNIEKVDGILFDLGVSSPQLDNPERGFTYRVDAPLDMRMNQNQLLSAKEVVNTYSQAELTRILFEYGEEKFAKAIAKNIVNSRPLETTFQLVEVVKKSLPAKVVNAKGHPAKKTFQAIRIEVNNELESLKKALTSAIELLKADGRCVVITFHSLEDRIVKQAFNQVSKPQKTDRRLPWLAAPRVHFEHRSIKISSQEVLENNRAHSAHLRILINQEGK